MSISKKSGISMYHCWYGPQGDTEKPGWAVVAITFPKGGAGEVLHPSSSHCWTSSTKRYDIKALPHQDWKEHIVFFLCLQAVNYLTSTHNEQCKTSQNLIKRQRRGPGADGKWLTQLIKHPSVRLNMASPAHHLRKRWELLCITIFPFPLAPPSIYYIYYVDPCLFCCSRKDIYVHGLLLPDSFPLSWWDRNVDKSEATVKCRLIQVVFMQR